MEEISSAIVGEREKYLLYGDPGMGKTHCALTIPDPIYFLSVGGPNEAKTYFSKKFQKKHGKKTIFLDAAVEDVGPQGIVRTPKGFDEACMKLDEALESDDKGEKEFASIIIDNATILSEYQMNKVIKISSETANVDSKTTPTYDKYIEHGILTPFDSDWGAAQSLMSKFVSWIFSLEKNVVFVAHEHETTTQDRRTRTQTVLAVKPLFVGKQRDLIANMFDNVWRMQKQGQLYYARTEPEDKPATVIAKTRIGGVFDPEYIDPNLSEATEMLQAQARSV